MNAMTTNHTPAEISAIIANCFALPKLASAHQDAIREAMIQPRRARVAVDAMHAGQRRFTVRPNGPLPEPGPTVTRSAPEPRASGRVYEAKPVTIRGVAYLSAKAAGEALGVLPSTVRWAMRRGTLDTIGLGCRGNDSKRITCTLNGVTYESQSEACRVLGMGVGRLKRLMDLEANPQPPKRGNRVTVRGVEYHNFRQVAALVGVSRSRIGQISKEFGDDGLSAWAERRLALLEAKA